MREGLTERQQRFVAEYLKDLNATQACIRAGYSKKNADKIGPELLGKTRVFSEIQRQQKIRAQRTEVTQDQVIRELADDAFMSLQDILDLKDVIKARDKITALIKLGEHTGLFRDQGENNGRNNAGENPEIIDRRLSEILGEVEVEQAGRANSGDQGTVQD